MDEAERLRLDQSNQLSLRTFAESGVPASDKNIKAIARERRRSLTTEQAALDRQLLITQNKVNEVSVLNSTDLSDSGEVLRSQHAIEVKKLTDEAANKYRVARRINASLERHVELDATGVTSLHKEYIDDPLFDVSPQDMPNVFSRLNRLAKKKADDAASILDASGKPMRTTDDIPAKVDYEEYHAMRQAVNQDIQVELGRAVPNRRRVRALTRMKKRIDKMGNQLKETEPALYQADLDANTFYRDEVAPKAFRGINHKMGLGEDRLANEKVVEQYWKPKGVTNARRFKALYGDNEAANAALEGGVLRLYRDTVVKNGAIDTMAHARFMKRYEENFNEFPQLRQILNDKDAATRTLNQRAGELADNIDEINDSIWFKHVDFGDKEPSRIIKDALKNPRTMSRTVLTMPKHQREAFAASLLSDVYESSRNADGFIDAGKLDALMSQHSEAIRTGLRHGFGATKAKAHMARLKVVSEAADILAENTVSITTTGKGTRNINIGRFDTGIPLTTAVAQTRAVQTGRTGIHYVLAVLSTQTGLNANKQMTEALEKKLLYDPDTSLELIRMFKAQQKAGGMPDVARMKQFVSKSIGYVFGEGQVQRNLRAVAPKLGLEGRTEAFGEQEQQ
jgi:hypothetical protein